MIHEIKYQQLKLSNAMDVYLFYNVYCIFQLLFHKKGVHMIQKNSKMAFPVAKWNENGHSLSGRTVFRHKTTVFYYTILLFNRRPCLRISFINSDASNQCRYEKTFYLFSMRKEFSYVVHLCKPRVDGALGYPQLKFIRRGIDRQPLTSEDDVCNV